MLNIKDDKNRFKVNKNYTETSTNMLSKNMNMNNFSGTSNYSQSKLRMEKSQSGLIMREAVPHKRAFSLMKNKGNGEKEYKKSDTNKAMEFLF